MAWTKVWIGTTGDYSLYTNWTAISVRNSGYLWTASGSGTDEYYLRATGPVDPAIGGTPGGVYINGTLATSGSPGTLALGRWGYGDNDTLGYSTIYVRLSDGTDPDSKAVDYVQFQSIPTAADNVRIPRGSGTITSGLAQSAVAVNAFIVELGYSAAIGSAAGYLQIDPDSFSFESTGAAYIDLGTAAIDAEIRGTASASTGYRGLYLKGTALDVLNIMSGSVGLAAQAGEVSTVDNIKINGTGASLWLGSGVTVSTGADLFLGTLKSASTIPTTNLYGGTLEATLAAALTAVNLKGGTLYHNGSGTLGTLNCYAGIADWTRSGTERTVTTINCYKGGSYTLRINRPSVTYTNDFTLAESVTFSAS
jgi:hypothetical protein